MAPPRKKARTSPATTAASSPPPASTTKASVTERTTPSPPYAPEDAWTPAQTTALFKLLITNKPTGIHKHMAMLSIYNSLQSQGLTHIRPDRDGPALPIAHMLPQGIWKKLDGLYDLESCDHREEWYRLDRGEHEGTTGKNAKNKKNPSDRDEWVFEREFAPDAVRNAPGEAHDLGLRMFLRGMKKETDSTSSPGLEERSLPDTQSTAVETPPPKGKGRASLRGSLRSTLKGSTSARRGSKTTTATTSTADEDGEDDNEEAEEVEEEDTKPAVKPKRAIRGSTRQATKDSKGKKKKG